MYTLQIKLARLFYFFLQYILVVWLGYSIILQYILVSSCCLIV
jgi:hypothetical protein